MTARIEPVATLASGFRWAATYSLLLDGDHLYVVRVGPAMGPGTDASGYIAHVESPGEIDVQARLAGALGVAAAQPALRAIGKNYGAKIEAGFVQLAERGHDAMADEKGSFRFSRSDVTAFEAGRKGQIDTLTLVTSARTFPFRVAEAGTEDFEAFAGAVRQWAGIS
ncbi:MAG: hypothetical protein AAGK21_07930 [Bacteroidota bacterium]